MPAYLLETRLTQQADEFHGLESQKIPDNKIIMSKKCTPLFDNTRLTQQPATQQRNRLFILGWKVKECNKITSKKCPPLLDA